MANKPDPRLDAACLKADALRARCDAAESKHVAPEFGKLGAGGSAAVTKAVEKVAGKK